MLYSLKEGLKRARKEAGLTQAQLAEKYGVHIKTVMNWEQGIAEPSLGTLMDLTELYHCDLDYLTGRLDQKTHDLQFIHDQTGLSEKAIEKLQSFMTEPDWDQMEKDLRESAPEIPEEKIHEIIQRQRESWETSPARDYSQIISLILEDLNSEYLLSLITKRVKGYQPRSRSDRPLTHKELTQDDLWIDLDGQRVLTHKRNMLDSLIQSEVASMIPVITETYHSINSEMF
jgi:transcriptional regulator with XRE-family HTH domain